MKKILLLATIIALVALAVPGAVLAQEPTEDFEAVRSKIAEWLESGPSPTRVGKRD